MPINAHLWRLVFQISFALNDGPDRRYILTKDPFPGFDFRLLLVLFIFSNEVVSSIVSLIHRFLQRLVELPIELGASRVLESYYVVASLFAQSHVEVREVALGSAD